MPGRCPLYTDLLCLLNPMVKSVTCPNCGKPVEWIPESKWRPFCSDRCRLIDIGEWLDEGHRISEPIQDGFDTDMPETEPDGGSLPRPH